MEALAVSWPAVASVRRPGSCKTKIDNPEHPSCSESCTGSEGVAHPCQLEGPIIGPPKDPFTIKFLANRRRRRQFRRADSLLCLALVFQEVRRRLFDARNSFAVSVD